MLQFLVSLDLFRNLNKQLYLIHVLAWQDIRMRYRRSVIGPFWLTISMAILIAVLGVVFGQVFPGSSDRYFPHLTAGIIFWTFLNSSLTEGCYSFIESENVIRQLPLPFTTFIFRVVWRNTIILGHNIVVLPIVMFFFGVDFGVFTFLIFPGLLLFLINISWVVLFLAIVSTRYRDLPNIVASLLQIGFYLTPIIWLPEMMTGRVGYLVLTLNPLYHLIEVVRAPLMMSSPSASTWIALVMMGVIGWSVTLLVLRHTEKRIAFWV